MQMRAPAKLLGCILTPMIFLTVSCMFCGGSEEASVVKDQKSKKENRPQDRPLETSPTYWDGDHLTGSWNGARQWAEDRGLNFEFTYVGEVMNNTRGGLNTSGATEYVGAFDVTVELDVKKMGGWEDGTFFFWFENIHGEGLTENHVGDFQTLSNLEEAPFSTLYEWWYKHELLDGRLWLKAGKIDANGDFAASDYAGEFIQSSFGFPPQIPFGTFPDPGLAVQVGYRINDWAYVQAMYQDGAPEGKSLGGFKDLTDGEGGHIGLFEFHFTPPWLPEKLPGTYRFGAWHHTGDWEELGAKVTLPEVSSNYGFYLIFDQRLFKERAEKDDEQGLGFFLQYSWAPLDRNEAEHYLGTGLVYTGAIPNRDEDVLGIGMAHVQFSNRLHATDRLTFETAIELFYRLQVTPFLTLQPQLQFIQNPGGNGRDALAAGLRFEVNF